MPSPTLTVCKASAGSGKTFTLTARYIALLLATDNSDAFMHLLAVTFTIKATSEMKDRILGTLYQLASHHRKPQPKSVIDPESKKYVDAIQDVLRKQGKHPIPTEELCRRADATLHRILLNYDRFNISTIDSFFQRLLRGVAHELNLPASLRTEISDQEVRCLAVERLMSDLSDPQLRQQVWNYVKDRIDDNQRWNISQQLIAFSSWLYKEDYTECRAALNKDLSHLPQLQQQLRCIIQAEKYNIEQAATQFFQQVPQPDYKDIRFTPPKGRKSRLYQLYEVALEMQACRYYPDPKDDCHQYLAQPQSLLRDPNNVQDLEAAMPMVNALRLWMQEYESESQRLNTAELALSELHSLGLLETIGQKVCEINQEQEQFLLADTGTLLHDLLNSEGNTEFVFEKVGPLLNHILIDEFQDTSRRQWSNFRPLITELLSQEEKSNLLVGDVKQSIYRWRGGDWSILHGLGQREFQTETQIESLDINYRSDSVIIDFNNRVFPKMATLLDELSGSDDGLIASAYQDVRQKTPDANPQQGYVYLRIATQKNDPNQYADLCQKIADLHEQQGVPYGDMVLLIRSQTCVPHLVEAMNQHPRTQDIRLVSADSFLLGSSLTLRLLIAALRYLYDPTDKVSATFLEQQCGKAFVADPAWKNYPLYELNETLIHQLRSLHFNCAAEADFVMCYLDEIVRYSQNNPTDIASFLTYWEEKLCQTAITCTDKTALQIVTIHKAKGLAFPYVFMPDCEFPLCRFHPSDLRWLPTKDMSEPYTLLPVLPIPFNNASKLRNSEFRSFWEEEVRQQLMDALNLLYVGFTRSKHALFVWGVKSKTLSTSATVGTLLQEALQQTKSQPSQQDETSLTYQFGELRHSEAQPKGKENRMEPSFQQGMPCHLTHGDYKMEFRQSTSSRLFAHDRETLQQEQKINEGILFHTLLENMRTVEDMETSIALCRQMYVLTDEQIARFRQLVQKSLQNPLVQSWFCPQAHILLEQTLILPDSICRPDRVIITENRISIIDYKCTHARYIAANYRQTYREQVAHYMHVFQRYQPERPVHGYLWFLKDNVIEEVNV